MNTHYSFLNRLFVVSATTAIISLFPSQLSAEQPVSVPPKTISVPTIMHGTRDIDDGLDSPDRLNHKQWIFTPEDPSIEWTDITPEYFEFHRFNPADMSKMVSTTPTLNNHGSQGSTSLWLYDRIIGPEGRDMSKGVLFFSGGALHDDFGVAPGQIRDQRANFVKGMQIVDFGDEVGRVLTFNGIHSTLNDSLKTDYYRENTAPAKAELILYDTSNGGNKIDSDDYTLLFFPVDYNKYYEIVQQDLNSTYTIRARVEFNTFAKEPQPGMAAMGDVTGILDNYGLGIRSDRNDDYNGTVTMKDKGLCYQDWDENGKWRWDATKWVSYDVNLVVDPALTGGTISQGIPCVKVQFPGNNLINLGAHFIRNVQMYITKGEIPETSPSYIKNTKFEVNNYYLRPSLITLNYQKLFVGEPAQLKSYVLPTWTTREVYWTLVDDDDATVRYRSLAEIPDGNPILDRIKEFDSNTGEILAKKNGVIRVQAVSIAEGANVAGVDVEHVMSCVTELPIFDVIYGIDLNHEHHAVDDNGIELSGSESTRVEYVLKTKKDVPNPKFDPETSLALYVGGDYLAADKDKYQHGFNYTQGYFDGKGWIDIFLSEESLREEGSLTLKVTDGRESWPMYASGILSQEYGEREGSADLLHYAKPQHFRIADNIECNGIATAKLFENELLGQWIWMPAKSGSDYFIVTPLLHSLKDNSAGVDLHAKQLYTWQIDQETNPDGRYIQMEDMGDGRIKLTPNISPDTKQYLTYIHLTPYYAGAHKSALAKAQQPNEAMSEEGSVAVALDSDFFDNADSADPVYLPYGPDWQRQFVPVDAAQHDEKVGETQSVLIELTNTGTSGVESVEIRENNHSAEYYNLKGIKTDSPLSGGVYILRQGAETKPVIVR